MNNYNINKVWQKLIEHEGETFKLIRGKEFVYAINNYAVIPNTTNFPIHKSNFEKALLLMPLSSTKEIQSLCMGPSYVYALLMDDRITGGNENGQ